MKGIVIMDFGMNIVNIIDIIDLRVIVIEIEIIRIRNRLKKE